MALTAYALVAAGGACGACLRFMAGRFGMATIAINVIGCLAAGLLAGLCQRSEPARQLLLVGVLGGFTTFSAFGLETLTMLKDGQLLLAALNAGGSVALGLAAVWLGTKAGL